jgi:hypothetical protein
VIVENMVGHAMIDNNFCHFLPSLVQCTNPFITISCIKRFNVQTKHPNQNMLGYISSMIAPTALQLETLMNDEFNDIV